VKYKALVVEDNSEAVEMIEDVMDALSHEHDLAASLLQARKLLKQNGYHYVLLDNEFPARSARGIPRVQNAENFLDDLATAEGKDTIPVIVMLDKAANGLEETVEMMRLAANLRDRGAADFIGKPFPTAGRTLDRVIKKALGLNGTSKPRSSRAAPTTSAGASAKADQGGKTDGWLTVTQAAELLVDDLPALDIKKARSRISTAASRKAFTFTGIRKNRRIEPNSFAAWRLKQRNRDLRRED